MKDTIYHISEVMSPNFTTKGIRRKKRVHDQVSIPPTISKSPFTRKILKDIFQGPGTRIRLPEADAVLSPGLIYKPLTEAAQEEKPENVFALTAEKQVRELAEKGWRLRVVSTGKLQPNPHDEVPEIFFRENGAEIESIHDMQNGRLWGVSRRVQDGKQVVDIWAMVPPEEARK